MYGYLIQLDKSFTLSHALLDENSIEVLHIRQADKFVDCCVVANITF